VTSGTSIIKDEIADEAGLSKFYTVNALGLEALSLEWIVKSMRPGGTAFVVVPDGILGRVGAKNLRDFVLRQCHLDAIISLPPRTFFSNFESTYVLALTRKRQEGTVQAKPVFTYLVSSIGERLTSVRRETIPANDLPEMERLFRLYKGSGADIEASIFAPYGRCKLMDAATDLQNHWVIDRHWTLAEKIALGIEEKPREVSGEEMAAALDRLREAGERYATAKAQAPEPQQVRDVTLGTASLFELSIGRRVLRSERVPPSPDTVPVYSANVRTPFGHIPQPRVVHDTAQPSILWGIDGNFDFNLIPAEVPFDITDHTGRVQICPDVEIDPRFLVHELRYRTSEQGFDRSFRASLANMRQFTVQIPVTSDGDFDKLTQAALADHYEKLDELRREVIEAKSECDELFDHFVTAPASYDEASEGS
jgi:type I restriction enzyme M protein